MKCHQSEWASSFELDRDQIELANCFSKQDWQLQYIAMLLLTELKSGGVMGQIYVESLTQMLVQNFLK